MLRHRNYWVKAHWVNSIYVRHIDTLFHHHVVISTVHILSLHICKICDTILCMTESKHISKNQSTF